jgi:hypothetical protein
MSRQTLDRFCRKGANTRSYFDNRNYSGSGRSAIDGGDKRGHNRPRRCCFAVPLVLADDKKERCKCHTVYHEGRGRRYGDCRKGVIETLPAGYVPLVNILAKRTISFLADFEE